MNSLKRLKDNPPDWVLHDPLITSGLAISASSAKPSGAPGRAYQLIIAEKHGSIEIREQDGRNILPTCCVERHINPGGTFCIFHKSTKALSSDEAAIDWWNGLKQYLTDQEYAHSRGEWPIHRGLSHGDAADIQLKMEALAKPLGWRHHVLNGIFRSAGWLGTDLAAVDKNTGKLRNQRSPCPVGCHYIHAPTLKTGCSGLACSKFCRKFHRPVLKIDCPNRITVNQLAQWEHQRRHYERRVIATIRSDGITCCGTMKRCALRD